MKLKLVIGLLVLSSRVYALGNCYILDNPESRAACEAQAYQSETKQQALDQQLQAIVNAPTVNSSGYTASQGRYDNLPTQTPITKNPYQQQINNQVKAGY